MVLAGCYNASMAIMRSEIFGEIPTRGAFDDNILGQSPPVVAVRSIRITQSYGILSLQVTYQRSDGSLYVAGRHGDYLTVYRLVLITLAQGECIVRVQGTLTGSRNPTQLLFETVRADGSMATYGPFGDGSGFRPFSLEGNILGFYGYAGNCGNALCAIGFDYQSLGATTDATTSAPTDSATTVTPSQ